MNALLSQCQCVKILTSCLFIFARKRNIYIIRSSEELKLSDKIIRVNNLVMHVSVFLLSEFLIYKANCVMLIRDST